MNENTAIVTANNMPDFASGLQEERNVFCSFTPTTEEERKALFNAMNSPEYRVSNFINKRIALTDVFVETVPCTNKETGEVTDNPRVVLFDDKGHTYQCVSYGVYSAVKKLFSCYGMPATWENPVTVEVKQVNKGDRSLLTLEVV